MIGILANGRLGNQMFQYAFIYAASKKLNTSFFIYKAKSLYYFDLYDSLEKKNNKIFYTFIVINLLNKSEIKLSTQAIKAPIHWVKSWAINKKKFNWENTLDKNHFLLKNLKDNRFYEGYFQSEEYFNDYKKEICSLFRVKSTFSQEFSVKKGKLFNNAKVVSVHIRRTDYAQFGNENTGEPNLILPMTYYRKCLSLIDNINNYKVIFVSDDIEFVKNEFGIKPNYYFENNSEIIDFQMLLNANILVIANSTFSWWAAWLNRKEDKIVYAPNYFLGFKIQKFYPAGIKVNSWHWIDVY